MDGTYYCRKKFVVDDVTYYVGDFINVEILGPNRVEVSGDTADKAEWSLDNLMLALKKGLISDDL